MKMHKLKTWPEFFKAVVDGSKTFEIRKNDRDFKVGDDLMLQEFDPQKDEYSGNLYCVRVTYIMTDPDFVLPGYCVMGIERELRLIFER